MLVLLFARYGLSPFDIRVVRLYAYERTTRRRMPSNSSVMIIWHESLLTGVGSFSNSIMSASSSLRGPTRSYHSASTKTWQVAQEHAPPQSASMLGMLAVTAARIADSPTSA